MPFKAQWDSHMIVSYDRMKMQMVTEPFGFQSPKGKGEKRLDLQFSVPMKENGEMENGEWEKTNYVE